MNKIMGLDKTIFIFILLLCISAIYPSFIYELNRYLLGKIIIVCFVVYFAKYSVVLGMLSALILFVVFDENKNIIENFKQNVVGRRPNTSSPKRSAAPATLSKATLSKATQSKEGMTPENTDIYTINTVGEIIPPEEKININTNNKNEGFDKYDLENTIKPKNSNWFPIDKNMFSSSDNIEPFYVPLK